jgi:hypothetical protein
VKFVVTIAALAFGLFGLTGSAIAKPGDKAWSQCVWSSAPESAHAWLAMPLPTWQSNYTEPNVLLGHRLTALCDTSSVDPLKPNRMPNWKSLAAALRREHPKQAPPSAPAAVDVLLCRSTVEGNGEPLTFLYEIVRREGGRETVAFDQYYDRVQGQPLKLPQDLRIKPKDPSLVKRSCQVIGAKGELLPATVAEERG